MLRRVCTVKSKFPQFRLFSSNNDKLLRSWVGTTDTSKNLIDWSKSSYETLSVQSSDNGIIRMQLNRPEKLNALNMQMWEDLEHFFSTVESDSNARVVVVGGEGRGFSAGMDLSVFASLQNIAQEFSCEGRKREVLLGLIKRWQNIISAPEKCKVPVIAKIHGLCIGGAVDFITACDLRLCDNSAEFSIKEIDLAIVADIGTLQRLPTLVGQQQARELSYTGRHFYGEEAHRMGLVLSSKRDMGELDVAVNTLAESIALKSPITIRGVKKAIIYQRDHHIADAMEQVRQWNAAMLYSNDLAEVFTAQTTGRKPNFNS